VSIGHGSLLRARWVALGRLLRLWWEVDPGRATALVALSLGLGLLPVAEVHALRRLVEAAVQVAGGPAPAGAAVAWGAALSALALLNGSAWQVTMVVRNTFGEVLRTAIHERAYRAAHAMPLDELEAPARHDQLQRIRQGLEQRLLMLVWNLVVWLASLVTVVSLLLYLAQFHWGLPALLAAGALPGLWARHRHLAWRYLAERRQTPYERRFNVFDGLLTGRTAAAEIRLFGLGPSLIGQAGRLWQRLVEERLALASSLARSTFAMDGLNAVVYVGALAFGVQLLAAGRLGLGLAAALFAAVERFQGSVRWIGENAVMVYADLRYLDDYFAFVDGPRVDPKAGRRLPGPIAQGIVFERVSFTYRGAQAPALADVDLTIRPGERLALVGENGAGKTTLAKLLMGLYAPSHGRILVDGIDLREIAPEDWRQRIGAVFQDYLRYQSTPRENIGTGWVDRLDDAAAIAAAAARSGADEVAAALPLGLDTPLGKEFHEGHDLSVGQWQKLAIARAYLRPAELLILDEPASALDARAEAGVYDHFAHMAQGRTVLLISHRLGSCRLADRIVVLRHGRLVEQGTHAALLAAAGEYAGLYHLQAAWYR
jgi:ABC-type multidrug transport system fused ATPase/permease subunit